MRLSLSLIALLAAFPALADEVPLRADIVSGIIYAQGAELTRTATVDLPAGTHRLYIAMPDLGAVHRPQLRLSGADLLGQPTRISGLVIAEGALDRPDEAAARETVEAARDAVEAAEDAITAGQARVRAAETQLAYLEGLTSGEGITFPEDAETLTQILSALGTETARAAEALREAHAAQEPLMETLEEAREDLVRAEQALARLLPLGTTINALAVDVAVAEAGTVALELDYLSNGAAWQPSYRLDLDSDTGALAVTRLIGLRTQGVERWIDTDLVFSTANPNRQREPLPVSPDVARIFEPPAPAGRSAFESADSMVGGNLAIMPAEAAPAPMPEAVAIFSGLSIRYDYQQPVTVTTEVELPFDTLEFDAELTRLAAPRYHDTAFLMAEFENDAGEPLIPGQATFYRDGDLIGDGYFGLLASGAEVELPFGPLDQIALDWQDLSRDAGDRGIFTQSNVETRRVRFSAENLSDEEETVRILYATPFSEVEDLDVSVELSQAPTERDVDDLRGVHAWEVTLAPGESYEIEMTVELDWPDGQQLGWQP